MGARSAVNGFLVIANGLYAENIRRIVTVGPVLAAEFLNSAFGPGMVDILFPSRTFKSDDPTDDIQEIIETTSISASCRLLMNFSGYG